VKERVGVRSFEQGCRASQVDACRSACTVGAILTSDLATRLSAAFHSRQMSAICCAEKMSSSPVTQKNLGPGWLLAAIDSVGGSAIALCHQRDSVVSSSNCIGLAVHAPTVGVLACSYSYYARDREAGGLQVTWACGVPCVQVRLVPDSLGPEPHVKFWSSLSRRMLALVAGSN
jgi:hypothetical protein